MPHRVLRRAPARPSRGAPARDGLLPLQQRRRSARRTRWRSHGLERVAIVDFDVHHGNGTEDIFQDDPRVLMVSTFQHPLYPYCGLDNPAPNMVNVPLRRGRRQRRVPRGRARALAAGARSAPAAAHPDLGGLRRAPRGSARGPQARRGRLRVGDARAGRGRGASTRRAASCPRSKAATRCPRSAAARPSTSASSSPRERAARRSQPMPPERRSSPRMDAVERREFLRSCAGCLRRCGALGIAGVGRHDAPRVYAARGSSTSTARRSGPRARRRDQLRLPLSVRRDAVLPAQAAAGRVTAEATLRARGRHARTRGRAASDASASDRRVLRDLRAQARVSDARGLVHPLPARALGDVRRAGHPLLRRPQRLRSGGRRARACRARRRSRSPRSCSSTMPRRTSSTRSAPWAPSSSTRSSRSTNSSSRSSTARRGRSSRSASTTVVRELAQYCKQTIQC